MEESVKIAIDIMGGDKSPDKNLEGINLFLKRNKNIKDVFFHIYGDEIQIKSKIGNFEYLKNNYKIHDTKIVVSDKLSALSTIKKGKNSIKLF